MEERKPNFKYTYVDKSEEDRQHELLFGTDAEHYIFSFKNGYGASVVRSKISYGHERKLYELAVLKNGVVVQEEDPTVAEFLEKFSKEDTKGVVGNLKVDDVNFLLDVIKSFPVPEN